MIFTEWARINKTLEAADKASHVPVAEDVPSTSAVMPPPPLPTRDTLPDGPSTSSRPMIKLKPSGSANNAPKAPEALKVKPKPRKPKVVDVPPPPYIDDGSHDLLQEVIAMEKEKEKDGKRRRSISEKDRGPEKRQRLSSEEDDDILALTLPISSKRKNSALASPSATNTVANGVNPKASPASHSGRNDSTTEIPSAQPTSVRISLKGKEKESVPPPPTPAPSKPRKTSAQTTPIKEKKCRDVLKALLKLPEAGIFSRPVDPAVDGCPT